MYNGIGLPTPRGSGTSGHVQSNKSRVNSQRARERVTYNRGGASCVGGGNEKWHKPANRAPNPEILEHARKRRLEAKIYEIQVTMEEGGFSKEEIQAKVDEMRQQIAAREASTSSSLTLPLAPAAASQPEGPPYGQGGSHAAAVSKNAENDKFRKAFRLEGEYREGDAFDVQIQERKKQERIAAREAKLKQRQEEEKRRRRAQRERQKERERTTNEMEEGEVRSDDNDSGRKHARKNRGGSSRRDDLRERRHSRGGSGSRGRRRSRDYDDDDDSKPKRTGRRKHRSRSSSSSSSSSSSGSSSSSSSSSSSGSNSSSSSSRSSSSSSSSSSGSSSASRRRSSKKRRR